MRKEELIVFSQCEESKTALLAQMPPKRCTGRIVGTKERPTSFIAFEKNLIGDVG